MPLGTVYVCHAELKGYLLTYLLIFSGICYMLHSAQELVASCRVQVIGLQRLLL